MDNNPFDKKPTDAPKAGDPSVEKTSLKAEAPKKKKGLSVGKIVSIFAGLLLIGVVVGTLMYSQSGERFQGYSGLAVELDLPDGVIIDAVTDYYYVHPSAGMQLCITGQGDCAENARWEVCDGQESHIMGPGGFLIPNPNLVGYCTSILSYYEKTDYCSLTVEDLQDFNTTDKYYFNLSTDTMVLLAEGEEAYFKDVCDDVTADMTCDLSNTAQPPVCEVPAPTCNPALNEYLDGGACSTCDAAANEQLNPAGDGCEATACPAANEYLDSGTCAPCGPNEEVNVAGTGCDPCDANETLNLTTYICETTACPAANEYLDAGTCSPCGPNEEVNVAGTGCDACDANETLNLTTYICETTACPAANEYLDAGTCSPCGPNEEVNVAGTGCDPCGANETLNLTTYICETTACPAANEYLDAGTCSPCGPNEEVNVAGTGCDPCGANETLNLTTYICETALTCNASEHKELNTAEDECVCVADYTLNLATQACDPDPVICTNTSEYLDTTSNTCLACGENKYQDATDQALCAACSNHEYYDGATATCTACTSTEVLDLAGNTCTACPAGQEYDSGSNSCMTPGLVCTAPDYINAAGDACATPAASDTICTDLTTLKDEMLTNYSDAVDDQEDWTDYNDLRIDIKSILANNPSHADLTGCSGFSACDLEFDEVVQEIGNLDINNALSTVYMDRSTGTLNSCYTFEDVCDLSKLTANELSKLGNTSLATEYEQGFRDLLVSCKENVSDAATQAGYMQDLVDYVLDLLTYNNTSYIAGLFPTAYAAAGDLSDPVMDIIDDIYDPGTTTTTTTSSSGGSTYNPGSGGSSGAPLPGGSSGTTTSTVHGAAGVCRSLEITNPSAAQGDTPTATISADGYLSEMLQISVDADAGAVADYRYKSLNGTITFNGVSAEYDTAAEVVYMDGGPTAGGSDTITIWALDGNGDGIATCHDAFVVSVEGDVLAPEPVVEPAAIVPEETHTAAADPEPETLSLELGDSEPVLIAAADATAPEQPLTGPGILIYVVGAGIGSLLLNRKKKK